MGRVGAVPGTREFPVTGLPYTLVYVAERETLSIITVVYQSRRYP